MYQRNRIAGEGYGSDCGKGSCFFKENHTRMYCEDGNMKVITLDAGLERTMVNSLARGENGLYLGLKARNFYRV